MYFGMPWVSGAIHTEIKHYPIYIEIEYYKTCTRSHDAFNETKCSNHYKKMIKLNKLRYFDVSFRYSRASWGNKTDSGDMCVSVSQLATSAKFGLVTSYLCTLYTLNSSSHTARSFWYQLFMLLW